MHDGLKTMKLAVTTTLLCLIGLSLQAQGHGDHPTPKNKTYRVVVMPADTTIETGSMAAFSAYLVDSKGIRKDTTFSWSLIGPFIGNIDSAGAFTGIKSGGGTVVASAGRLSGSAGIHVKDPSWALGYRVRVNPVDSALLIGQTLAMHAELVGRDDSVKDTTFVWEVSDTSVGFIGKNDGIFTAKALGHTTVFARVGSLFGRAHIVVLRDTTEWTGRQLGLHVSVSPNDTVTVVGGQIQFQSTLIDSLGTPIDTAFVWSFDGSCGTISETGLFSADSTGHGFIYASAGSLSGKAHVTVLRDSAQLDSLDSGSWKNTVRLVIEPRDTLVTIGQSVSFKAFLVDTSNARTETDVRWDLLGSRVGSINASGLFTASRQGLGLLRAKKEHYTAMTKIWVVASGSDTVQPDSAQIRFHDRSGGHLGNLHRLGEKDVLKIGGLPFPLNFLNGGELTFQPGALDEDVTIEISLPEFAVGDTSVEFPEGILTGASFQVYVNGILVHPFPFGAPIQVAFPLKRGLLEQLGLEPEDLGVFFSESNDLDSTGVSNVVVDTSSNMVYAEVEHFSNVVVARKTSTISGVADQEAVLPKTHRLIGNFPNPFNPETNIRFELAGNRTQNIRLTVIDIQGREVRTLARRPFNPGSHEVQWDGRDNAGALVGTGVYIYRLKGDGFTLSKRMVLLK